MKINDFKKLMINLGYELEEVTVDKNGKKVNGFAIGSKEKTIRPTLYNNFIEANDEEEILNLINKSFDQCPKLDPNIFLSQDYVKKNVITCLRHKSNNEELLKWIRHDDLEEYLKIICTDGSAGRGTIKITKKIAEEIGMDTTELLLHARENTRKTVTIRSMKEVLSGLINFEIEEEETDINILGGETMYVISANNNVDGASAMLFNTVLKEVAERLHSSKIIIIPSSIHECIVVSAEASETHQIDKMIQEVNDTQVNEIDQLSDHAYIIDLS